MLIASFLLIELSFIVNINYVQITYLHLFLQRDIKFRKKLTFMRDCEERVNDVVKKLLKAQEVGSYEFIHQELLKKRLGWYEQNKDRLELKGPDVRKAYTLLLIRYMGLNQEEVPVVYEDERKIVWRSYNFCPVLEACKRLGMDTREVCKKAEEKSVQDLISRINPNLRFSRNYEKIRPYEKYCEETIELI